MYHLAQHGTYVRPEGKLKNNVRVIPEICIFGQDNLIEIEPLPF